MCIFVILLEQHITLCGAIAQKLKRYEKLLAWRPDQFHNHHQKTNFHTSMLNVEHTAAPTMAATSAKAKAATHPKPTDSPK